MPGPLGQCVTCTRDIPLHYGNPGGHHLYHRDIPLCTAVSPQTTFTRMGGDPHINQETAIRCPSIETNLSCPSPKLKPKHTTKINGLGQYNLYQTFKP